MAVKLSKGGSINLSKSNPGLQQVMFAMGWKCARTGRDWDLDMSAFLLDENGKAVSSDDCVYYSNEGRAHRPYIIYGGDNTTGSSGNNDDETIIVDLSKVPAKYNKISFVVDIYRARSKNQHFGKVSNAYIRAENTKNREELLRYDLSDSYNENIGIYVAELVRVNGEWEFKTIGNGVNHGLSQMRENFRSGNPIPQSDINEVSRHEVSSSETETPRPRKKFLGIF